MELQSAGDIRAALARVAEQLAIDGERYAVVILGGAALNLLGIVQRSTSDVDILAFAVGFPGARNPALREPPQPIPLALGRALAAVARDMGLDPHWMNTGPSLQWHQGLPVGLDVGVVSRADLIFFKLYAAADDATTRSVHYKDLLALAPTAEELDAAAAWVRPQNASPEFHEILDQLMVHVRRQLHI